LVLHFAGDMAWERTETDHGVADIAAAGVTHMSILTQYVVPHAATVDRTRSSAVGLSVSFPLLRLPSHRPPATVIYNIQHRDPVQPVVIIRR
jgi:hypothetical protein